MILMALDHTRDFFGDPGVKSYRPGHHHDPTVLHALDHAFLRARFLSSDRHWRVSLVAQEIKRELSRFLFTRGLWLIFLEIVVVRCFGWQFNFDYHLTLLNVLWALGGAMITLSALVYLPASVVGAFGVVMIATHNLASTLSSPPTGFGSILHQPNFLLNRPGRIIFVAYPLIPWIGVTAAGYGLGQIYRWPPSRREGVLTATEHGIDRRVLGFARNQSVRRSAALDRTEISSLHRLSFLNTIKYPPSLLYLLMTLGPALLFLWAVDDRYTGVATARAHHRQSANVLLPPAYTTDPSDGHRVLLCALRARALDVRIAGTRPVSDYDAAGLGIFFADRIPGLDACRAHALSTLPLVRGFEAAPRGRLAELFLKSGKQNPLPHSWRQRFAGCAQH